jgi:hypothetical protein
LSNHPKIEFRTGLGVIFVNGAAFEILPGKVAKAVVNYSSCLTSNLWINAAGDWVMKSSERVLWLPPEYRPRTHTSYGNIIVLGSGSGHVFFLSFEDGLGQQIGNASLQSLDHHSGSG